MTGRRKLPPTRDRYKEKALVYEGGLSGLIERAEWIAKSAPRSILGICGPPGSGKSTLAGSLLAALGSRAALVPMDGFHLANSELIRLGRRDRKGAIDTFDGAGYVALIRRLRAADEPVVYAPEFRREIEEAIAGAIAIQSEVPLIITEGNYLLSGADPWNALGALLDQIWYVDPGEILRQERLIARHIAFGKSPDFARSWSLGPDQRNAEMIESSRSAADLTIATADLRT
jgi:pantothenate kinase